MSREDVKPIMIKKLPIILNRNILMKKPMNRKIKVVNSLQKSVQEDIIYTSKLGDFTSGEVLKMTIVNRLNISTHTSKTVAKCTSHSGQIFEKTSDEIINLIGQQNYDILLSSLCSIINQELKIRSINALLTVPNRKKSLACQTETNAMSFSVLRNVVDKSCQTIETCAELFTGTDSVKKIKKTRKRNKRPQLTPYVVKATPAVHQPRRIVISPTNFSNLFMKEETALRKESFTTEPSLPELGTVLDDDSKNNMSRFSSLSVTTNKDDLLVNPLNILTNVDKQTSDISSDVNQREIDARERLKSLESPGDLNPTNKELPFGVKEVLSKTPPDQRINMLLRQGFTNLKNCLVRDDDGNLPIHVAVLTNDVDLLKRQCFALKMKGSTVDVAANELTPLRMSLFQENAQLTAILLHFGADPLDTDHDDRTPFHIAAEMDTDHLQILINHCQLNARKVLHEEEQLWNPAYDNKPDEELAPILLNHINKLYDNQGYTPLMLASKVGKYKNVMSLVESSRASVNVIMPSSGNTALYLAVGAACMDSADRGNKAKILDHYSKIVEILVENGADPGIDNFSGSSVNDLLTEFNIAELSMLIANKLTSIRYFDGQLPNGIKGSDFMLFKDEKGNVNLKEMAKNNTKETTKPSPVKTDFIKPAVPKIKTKPIIIENIGLKPLVKGNNSTATVTKPNIKIIPGNLLKPPVKVGAVKAGKSLTKDDTVNVTQSYTPMVKNFQLNKPLIITSEVQNNKRKLDIVVDLSKSKKPNKNV